VDIRLQKVVLKPKKWVTSIGGQKLIRSYRKKFFWPDFSMLAPRFNSLKYRRVAAGWNLAPLR
jgi:hypothetical protein